MPSGYLISIQVTTLQAAGRLAPEAVRLRRARRPLPEMITLRLFALVSAILLSEGAAVCDFLWHMASAGLVVSNPAIPAEAGYFAPDSNTSLCCAHGRSA